MSAEIERRIAQRDRLWAHVQGPRAAADPDASHRTVDASNIHRLARRVEVLEEGLSRYLDAEWVANASTAELVAHARGVLRQRHAAPPGGESRVLAPDSSPLSSGWAAGETRTRAHG